MLVKVDTTRLNVAQEHDLIVELNILAEYFSVTIQPEYLSRPITEKLITKGGIPLGCITITGEIMEAEYPMLLDTLDKYQVSYTVA